ncbi:MAG: hypothetical protein KY476_27095, partial [Planctomycetes bacterium]|nr:hypothetical protein [Planctomycetota bacterium]
ALVLVAAVFFALGVERVASAASHRSGETASNAAPSAVVTAAAPLPLPEVAVPPRPVWPALRSARTGGPAGPWGQTSTRPRSSELETDKLIAAAELHAVLKQRLAQVAQRERELAQRQELVELVYEDVHGEQSEMDALRAAIRGELDRLQRRTAARTMTEPAKVASPAAQPLDEHPESFEPPPRQMTNAEPANGVELQPSHAISAASSMGGPEIAGGNWRPESLAAIVSDLVEQDNIDAAARLLGTLKEREAAQVLAALPDPRVADRLLIRLQELDTAAR